MDQPTFQAQIVNDAPLTVFRVTGELDVATAPALRALLDTASEHARRVVVDMEHVGFIDSTGISVLLAAARRAKDANGEFVVRNPTPVARRVFEILALDGQLPIEHESEH